MQLHFNKMTSRGQCGNKNTSVRHKLRLQKTAAGNWAPIWEELREEPLLSTA